jgi:hypothetical protein
MPGLKIHGDSHIIFMWHNSQTGAETTLFLGYDFYERAAEDATYAAHNKHKGRTSVPSARIEPAILRLEHSQTLGLILHGHWDRHIKLFLNTIILT